MKRDLNSLFITAKLTFGDHICESAPSVSALVNLSYDNLFFDSISGACR